VTEPKRPMAEANGISQMLNLVLGADRFPVKVADLALEYSSKKFPDSPIAKIHGDELPGLDGMLKPNKDKSKWLIIYDASVTSPGRINFTIAHEFGHYLLHRQLADKREFLCSTEDTAGWSGGTKEIENDADKFAATLLMPIDDYRRQVASVTVNLDVLSGCADRYATSMQAVIRRWVEFTPERAVMVVSRSGFIKWSWSSQSALKSGAFFRFSKETIPIPQGSLAARGDRLENEREGIGVPARIWFPREPADMPLREMRIVSDQYDFTISLLIMPDRKPWEVDDEDEGLGLETTIERFERRGQPIIR
jgi:hypothetical protein